MKLIIIISSLFFIISDNNFIIKKNKLGKYKNGDLLTELDSKEFVSVIDSFYFDNEISLDEKIQYKKCILDNENKEYILFEAINNSIFEISTNSNKFSTQEGLKIGMNLNDVLVKLNGKFSIIEEFTDQLVLFDNTNKIRLYFSKPINQQFSFEEISNKILLNKQFEEKVYIEEIEIPSFK